MKGKLPMIGNIGGPGGNLNSKIFMEFFETGNNNNITK